jgi:hypothetical protein
VEKFPRMGAKIVHDVDILSTYSKKIFPYLAWVSRDFQFV